MRNKEQGATLMELLIIVVLIILVVIAIIALLKPQEQIYRSMDTQRKHELNELRKVFEDWYTDKGCYPKKTEVCFNNLSSATCEICTKDALSPSFLKGYTTGTICDPQSPNKNYLYQIGGDPDCPKTFIVYTKLAAAYAKESDIYGCTPLHGCGPGPYYGYDYYVTSPNASVPIASNYYCYTNMGLCSNCGTYDTCDREVDRGTCVTVHPSKTSCCSAHPGAGDC